jgi:hypothetical protein
MLEKVDHFTSNKLKHFVRQGLANNMRVHIKQMHTHIKEIELKQE